MRAASRFGGALVAATLSLATVLAPAPSGGAVVPGINGPIAFQRCTGVATCQIYRMNANRTGLARPTSTGLNQDPAWSPDGTRIAFASNRSGAIELWIMSATGTGLRQLTTKGWNFDPSWSPDGTRIAFVSTRTGSEQIFVKRSRPARSPSSARAA